jgi:hypothetical protein
MEPRGGTSEQVTAGGLSAKAWGRPDLGECGLPAPTCGSGPERLGNPSSGAIWAGTCAWSQGLLPLSDYDAIPILEPGPQTSSLQPL